jgi:uncharacterized protein (DUF2062 family)
MLFRRRTKPTLGERVRDTFWPRGGWRRALKYFRQRILRLNGSPHVIAMGFAAGLFVAWSPFFGFHYLLAIACAFIVRGNILAAVLGTTIGNPLTLPAMWALNYKLGEFLLGESHAPLPPPPGGRGGFAEESLHAILPILKPMLLGSIPLGLVSGAISYFVVRVAVHAYQSSRRQRLEARRRGRAAARPAVRMI